MELKSFKEHLQEGWFEKSLRNWKTGRDERKLKKLGKIHSKLLIVKQKALQNKYRFDVVRYNYEHIKQLVLDGKRIVNSLQYKRGGVDQELLDAVMKIDQELDYLQDFAVEGLHQLAINHRL